MRLHLQKLVANVKKKDVGMNRVAKKEMDLSEIRSKTNEQSIVHEAEMDGQEIARTLDLTNVRWDVFGSDEKEHHRRCIGRIVRTDSLRYPLSLVMA